MDKDLKYTFGNLKNAIKRLEEGINQAKNQLDRDGVIQRFEFSFELLWKTLKLFLKDQGIITRSPKEVFKEAFRFGLLKDENILLDMLEDRNQTSHIYNEITSKKIYSRIKKNYMPLFKKLLRELTQRIE